VGQVLVLVAIALPLFFSICALVVDGTNLMVHRRAMQNAADASALAASRDLAQFQSYSGSATCDISWPPEKNSPQYPRKAVVDDVEWYSAQNDGPGTLNGGSCTYDDARCSVAADTNCYTWPYKGDNGLIEVRLRKPVSGFFTTVAHLKLFNVSARAVARVQAITQPHCVYDPPIVDPDSHLPDCNDIPGTFVPGDGGVGFAMSSSCVFDPDKSAISYTGAGGGTIGALETNGGFTGGGAAGSKTIASLSLGRKGQTNPAGNKFCYDDPGGAAIIQNPPVGGPFAPKGWPAPLPTIPTPGSGCTGLGSASITFTVAGHPPGVYCVTGTTATLTLSALDLSAGYTFFAPNIAVQGGTYKCYLLCAGFLGTNDQTLFYATGPTGRVTMNGSAPSVTGNIYAPNGEIAFSGGGVSGGSGFLESQTLKIVGNFADYHGTGGFGGHVEGGSDGRREDTVIGANLNMDE